MDTELELKVNRILAEKPTVLQLLRFAAIGVLNTALDFIIFNLASKSFNIEAGYNLGLISIIGFAAAMVQSYFWNRYWAFGSNQVALLRDVMRLFLVGGLGAASFLAVLAGARYEAVSGYYLIVLAVFLGIEMFIWMRFGLKQKADSHVGHFLSFTIVSIIGLVINTTIVAVVSYYLSTADSGVNTDLLKNVAKILATVASLVWNFIGYKLVVFKQ